MPSRSEAVASPPSVVGRNPDNITDNRPWILREVQNGLPGEKKRLAAEIENQAFYDLDGERYAPRREAETEFDFAGRPHRESGFTQQAIDRLCEYAYNPGPQRKVTGGGLAESLEDEYEAHLGENVTPLRRRGRRALRQLGDSSEPRVSKTS
mgnify:CR=1 FL=1